MSDRRNTFRALLAEARDAELCVGRRRHPVAVVEESSGGLCVVSGDEPPFTAGSKAELFTDDGDCLRVEIVHAYGDLGQYRVGLRRLDVDEKPSRRGRRQHTSPLILLLGLTLGLYAGYAFRLEPVRGRLAQLPTVAGYLEQR